MSETKRLKLLIEVDNSQLTGIKTFVNDWSRQVGTVLTGIGLGIEGSLGLAVAAFAEAQKSSLALDAALKSTNGTIGISRQELDGMATALSRVSTVDDDAISGAQALLLAYGNIGKEVFPRAIQAALDLSAALGQDMATSVSVLGKALNDPEHGLKGLKFLNDEQRELIKNLASSGDLMGAQTAILDALATAYGGRAKAEAAGFAGQLTQLKNEAQNLMEVIGSALVPMLSSLLETIKPVVLNLIDWAKANPELVTSLTLAAAAFGALALAVGPLLIALPGIVTAAGFIGPVLLALTGPIGLTVAAIAGLVAAGVLLYENSKEVRDIVNAAWTDLAEGTREVFDALSEFFTDLGEEWAGFWTEHGELIKTIIGGTWTAIKEIFKLFFQVVGPLLKGGLEVLSGFIKVWSGILTGDWGKFTEGLKTIWTGLWDALAGVVKAYWEKLKSAVKGVTDGVTGLFQGMYDKVVGHSIVPDMMADIGEEFGKLSGTAMHDPAKTGINSTVGVFTSAFGPGGTILGQIGSFGGSLADKMKSIAQSVSSTFVEWGTSKIQDALGKLSESIGGTIGSLLGKAAPVVGPVIGWAIGKLTKWIGGLFGRGQDKIDDTQIVQEGWPKIWALQADYAAAPGAGSAAGEAASRDAVLSAGIGGWNEMVKHFKRKESADSQRKYIFDWIKAINSSFSSRASAYPGASLPDLNKLPVTPMARGGAGVVTQPTLFLAGEAGAEEYAFRRAGRRGGRMGSINQTINITGGVSNLQAYRREMNRINRHLVRQLA